MIINDNYIINEFYFNDKNGKFKVNGKKLSKCSDNEKQYLLNRFNDCNDLKEAVQRIFYKIEKKNICPICGKPVKWLGKKNRLMLNTCSLECGFKLRQIHNEQHWERLYGVKNVFATNECVKQIKQTKLEKYGDENYNNHEQTVQTCIERYGVKNGGGSKETIEKNKQHFLKKYGVTTPFKDHDVKEKIKQTNLKKYGVENPNQNQDIQEKIKETCLKKYGKTSYLQSDEYKKNYYKYKKKRRETLKMHNKLTMSKAEAFIYNLLTHYFDNIICQYCSDDYPFFCDFYIPEIDTYIEYQGYYTHGKHPFDENNIEDITELNTLIEKNNKHLNKNNNLYYIKIQIWTKRDVKKRNIAKQNKLNYIEFWNYDEVKNWLKQYENK